MDSPSGWFSHATQNPRAIIHRLNELVPVSFACFAAMFAILSYLTEQQDLESTFYGFAIAGLIGAIVEVLVF